MYNIGFCEKCVKRFIDVSLPPSPPPSLVVVFLLRLENCSSTRTFEIFDGLRLSLEFGHRQVFGRIGHCSLCQGRMLLSSSGDNGGFISGGGENNPLWQLTFFFCPVHEVEVFFSGFGPRAYKIVNNF